MTCAHTIQLQGLDPLETMLARERGNLSQVLEFAAHRAAMAAQHNNSPDSTRSTVPARAT